MKKISPVAPANLPVLVFGLMFPNSVPRSVDANVRLGSVYEELGQYAEAIAVYKKGRELARAGQFFQGGIARVYALTGKRHEARQMISGSQTDAYGKAAVYTALDDKNEAFDILEKAVKERNSLLVGFKEDPIFETLHSDQRWELLLRRMNFPSE